jgi:hypothetical protein
MPVEGPASVHDGTCASAAEAATTLINSAASVVDVIEVGPLAWTVRPIVNRRAR